jgi:hypothetical protein
MPAADKLGKRLRPVVYDLYTKLMRREEALIYEGDSQHEHYQIVDMTYEGRPARVLFSGQRNAAQSGVATDDEPDLLFDYNQRFFELAGGLYPKRILIIGGGVFTLPSALVTALPEAIVDVLEIDPELTTLAEGFFGLRQNERLHIINEDGRAYVEKCQEKYDLIIVDAFHHTAIPRALSSLEAVKLYRGLLTKNGVVAVNIISAYYGQGAKILRSQYAAYQQLFKSISVFPAAKSLLSYWLPQNFVLVAESGKAQELTVRFGPLEALSVPKKEALHDES